MTRRRRSTAWLAARLAIEQAIRQRLGDDADVDIDWVTKAGEGLDRDVYVSDIEAQSSTGDIRGRFAVLLPRGDAPLDLDDRARREVALLDRLARLDLPFEIPRWSTTVEQGDRAVLVREFLGGVPLSEGVLPGDEFPLWDITGEIAAAVHATPTADLALVVGGYGTRRDHVAALLRETVDFVPDSVTGDAIEWIRSHMPPDDPGAEGEAGSRESRDPHPDEPHDPYAAPVPLPAATGPTRPRRPNPDSGRAVVAGRLASRPSASVCRSMG